MKTVASIIMIMGILLAACAKKPSACFELSHSNPFKVGEEITFDGSCSSHASFYQYFYKDGTFSHVSEEPMATHAFSVSGTYSVKLKAEGKNSNESNIEMDVIVVP